MLILEDFCWIQLELQGYSFESLAKLSHADIYSHWPLLEKTELDFMVLSLLLH